MLRRYIYPAFPDQSSCCCCPVSCLLLGAQVSKVMGLTFLDNGESLIRPETLGASYIQYIVPVDCPEICNGTFRSSSSCERKM